MKFYYADFETNTKNWGEEKARVGLWGIIDDHDNFEIGLDLKSFFNRIDSLKDSSVFFFHNGAKFDFEFIKHFLGEEREYIEKTPKKGSFDCLFETKSSTYGITYHNLQGKKIYFKDSYKFFAQSLATMFESEKIEVGEEFYHEIRDYKTIEDISKKDYEYMYGDVKQVQKIIRGYFSINKFSPNAYTSTGIAWKEFKKDINYAQDYKNTVSPEMYNRLKKWMVGGYCNLFPEYQNRVVKGVHVIDVNSEYPAVIRDTLVPAGAGWDCYDENCNNPVSLISVILTAKLKKGFRPFLSRSGGVGIVEKIEWLSKLDGELVHITQRMFELVQQYYNVKKFKIVERICFEAKQGIGQGFIDKYQEIKQTSVKGSAEYLDSKLKQNGCYGRTTMDYRREKFFMREPYPGEKIPKYMSKYGKYIIDSVEEISDEVMPLQLGIFILSNAKTEYLIPAIQKFGSRVVYCDTDSLHITNTTKEEIESKISLHSTKLGSGDYESYSAYGFYLARKFYALSDGLDSELTKLATSKIAKKSFKGKTIRDIINKNINYIQTRKERVDGGVFIVDQEQEVNVS